MKIDLKKGEVTIYEVTCRLCGEKIRSPEKDGCHKLLVEHVDNNCKIAKTMKDWERQGIYKEMMEFLLQQRILKEVEKLVKKYGFEKVKHALDMLELEE